MSPPLEPMIIEGFALETSDDLIFTVKGLIHPPDRVIAYLRYVPDFGGERVRSGVRYRRLYRFQEQDAVLRVRHPMYLSDDPVFGLRMQSVPRDHIDVVHDPREYLTSLRNKSSGDRLADEAAKLAQVLCESAAVQPKDLGISGSLMLGLQRQDSDLDLVVYGEMPSRRVYQTLQKMLDQTDCELRRPDRRELTVLHAEHRRETPLSFESFVRQQNRKVNEVRFRGHETFIRFVKLVGEIDRRYGDQRFERLGTAVVRARVTDDSDAIFTPCRYGVDQPVLVGADTVADLREIVSFRGRFSDQARIGEQVVARGSLERVAQQERSESYRLVVGGQSGDYLLAQKCE